MAVSVKRRAEQCVAEITAARRARAIVVWISVAAMPAAAPLILNRLSLLLLLPPLAVVQVAVQPKIERESTGSKGSEGRKQR